MGSLKILLDVSQTSQYIINTTSSNFWNKQLMWITWEFWGHRKLTLRMNQQLNSIMYTAVGSNYTTKQILKGRHQQQVLHLYLIKNLSTQTISGNMSLSQVVPSWSLFHGTKVNNWIFSTYTRTIKQRNETKCGKIFGKCGHPQLPFPNIALGDWNFVEDPQDKNSFTTETIPESFKILKHLWRLQDGWRATFPETRDYTCCQIRVDTETKETHVSYCKHWQSTTHPRRHSRGRIPSTSPYFPWHT
jgi:hypothetical protein